VDRDKQRQLRILAHDYLRRAVRTAKDEPPYRFDIVSVCYEGAKPVFELFQNAF
jgi:Holliday junction resolvase-like predicted endonuclease